MRSEDIELLVHFVYGSGLHELKPAKPVLVDLEAEPLDGDIDGAVVEADHNAT